MNQAAPIGVFDSGIGGLTVARAITDRLPNEQIIYFGDTVHLPYGDKSADAIKFYSLKIARFLLGKGCKMIVIACNSASSAAYDVLLEFFENTLFVNVVDPLIERVVAEQHQRIGVIATKATISSNIYQRQLAEQLPAADIYALATPLLVPMIEEGYCQNNITDAVLHQYLSDPKMQNLDALLLACTHYPLVRPQIESYLGRSVQVYDSTDVVARAVEQQLMQRKLLSTSREQEHTFYVSDYTEAFAQTARQFYGQHIQLQQTLMFWRTTNTHQLK